ncbi:hypothetical protein ANANG_G00067850 [Anguilla anguilla]|uniref:Beta-galactoside alpha-2,6-sialyltransferase 2 n=1 Tax=Anguilla anguilla TaxID=7936 RepID=A0A9D3MQ48_ANGAN|nr:hypothetical protein ANANG_G00067850 [Anguilla anguilla]
MKSGMRRWKLLVAMAAWAGLCVALLTYYMDGHSDERHSSAPLSHADARRLTSIQADNRPTAASRPEAASPAPARSPRPQGGDGRQGPARGPLTAPAMANSGNEAGGGGSPRTTRNRKRQENLKELEMQLLSKTNTVIRKLWKGEGAAHMLSPHLQRAKMEYLNANKHRAVYRGRRRTHLRGQDLLCEMKKQVQIRALDGTEQPFSGLGWDRLVPTQPLGQLYKAPFRTCAVVSSAGAILHSSLGKEIDSHDAVLRFNSAPTEGYEIDVGNKTTLRIINSQILAKPNHRFNTSSLYKDVVLLAWDPAPYTVNLHKWYRSPDYDLFRPYAERRRRRPAQPFYILHPAFLWQLWDFIQGHTQEDIQPNPPSSGFIGIAVMMSLCDEIDVYEYIPSLRQTDLCHYHERYYDSACTLGAYHPLLYEKMLIQHMNTGTDYDLKNNGRVTLTGFSAVKCDS